MTPVSTPSPIAPDAAEEDAARRLAARYPRPLLKRPVGVLALLLVVLLGGSWVGWAGWNHAHPAVVGRVDRYDLADDHVTVHLTVQRRDSSVAAVCHVIAQAQNFERVGELDLPVGPGGPEITVLSVDVRTFRAPVAASIEHCRTV